MDGGDGDSEAHELPVAADLQQGSLPAPPQLAAHHHLDDPLDAVADPGGHLRQPDRHDAFRVTQADPADTAVAANVPAAAAGMYDPIPVFRPQRLHADTTAPLTPSSSAVDHHNHSYSHHHQHASHHTHHPGAAFPGNNPHHRLHGTASHQHINRSSSSTSISSTGSSPRRSRPSTGLLARHPSSAAGPQHQHPPGRRPSVASSVVSSSSRGSDAAAAAAAAASASGAGGLVARRPKVSQACVYCRRSHMT
ncbi:hypothetical protein HK405_007683, partial [Cladochytrium tenue]